MRDILSGKNILNDVNCDSLLKEDNSDVDGKPFAVCFAFSLLYQIRPTSLWERTQNRTELMMMMNNLRLNFFVNTFFLLEQ